MYYELIILGTLMVGPFHGYLIAKIVQNILGPYGKISAGRLYPLLTKLEEGGLIVVEPVSEQQERQQHRRSHIPSRRYRITGDGRPERDPRDQSSRSHHAGGRHERA